MNYLNLTNDEMNLIEWCMENMYCDSVDTIFEVLEGTVDRYYEKIEKAQKKQPQPLWEE